MPKKILPIITSTFFSENDNFAENEVLILSGLVIRRKERFIIKLILTELTKKNIVKWYNIKGKKVKK